MKEAFKLTRNIRGQKSILQNLLYLGSQWTRLRRMVTWMVNFYLLESGTKTPEELWILPFSSFRSPLLVDIGIGHPHKALKDNSTNQMKVVGCDRDEVGITAGIRALRSTYRIVLYDCLHFVTPPRLFGPCGKRPDSIILLILNECLFTVL